MRAECKTIRQEVTPYPIPAGLADDPRAALTQAAKELGLQWLLAHADDGVIWGELRGEALHLSTGAYTPDRYPTMPSALCGETLQQVRLFGPPGELLIWRTGEMKFQGRLLIEDRSGETEVFDERYLLWGTDVLDRQDGFCLLTHGAEGFLHAPPAGEADRPLFWLIVRHTINYSDDDGLARVAYSRLVELETRRSS